MKKKLISKTTVWKYKSGTVIHTYVTPPKNILYFSSQNNPFEWDNGGYIDLNAPKPHFITRFKNRVKNFFKIK